MSKDINEQLARARERLLDLTGRNRLLNFRPAKRTSVRVVDELPSQVWQLLVKEQKSMGFRAREDHDLSENRPGLGKNAPTDDNAEPSMDNSLALPGDGQDEGEELLGVPENGPEFESGELPARYRDLFLQTSVTGENLQTNLLRIEQAATSALEEQGVNFLFLAIGFLEWRPAESSQEIFKAPIILVPVKLERTSARRQFKLSVIDEEPVLNPCLVAKLQQFHIELSEPPEEWEDFELDTFLKGVERALAGQAQWKVLNDIYLGLFSFTKYLMYVDLDAHRWPKGKGLTDNQLVRAMCGEASVLLPEAPDLPDMPLDDHLDPEEVFQVHDADSSQQRAILAAKNGRSLVIEGPPGTGKSQTITNIIAECLAAGKTVLFVSEKMAALEVVKRRLDEVELGDFCLELHSTKANRRAVLEEMQEAWNRQKARNVNGADDAQRLVRLRDRLNSYVKALHEPLGASGLTPYYAMGRAAFLRDVPDVLCSMPGHATWNRAQVEDMKELVQQLAGQLLVVHPIAQHPWRGARIARVTGSLQRAVSEILGSLAKTLRDARSAAGEAGALLGVKSPANMQAMKPIADAAKTVLASPEPPERLLHENLWDEVSAELQTLVGRIKAYVQGREWIKGRYNPQLADTVDWLGMYQRCVKHWTGPGRWFRPSFWSDRKTLKLTRELHHKPGFAELVADLRQLGAIQTLRDQLNACQETGQQYYDDAWQGHRSDWAQIVRLTNWLRAFRPAVKKGQIGGPGVELASRGKDRSGLANAVARLEQNVTAWNLAWNMLVPTLSLQDPGVFALPAVETPLDELDGRLKAMSQRIESLFDWAQYQEAVQACESSPMAEFILQALAENVEPEVVVLAVEKQYLRLLVEGAFAEREALRKFNAANHEADRLAFAQLDRQWVKQTGYRLQAKLAAQQPERQLKAAPSSQLGILSGEIHRKRGGRSIRRLLHDACDAIQKLTPCLMMSPLSVARFIDPEGMRFDVVVFDEASQVEPADALGAIARGTQLILVGDPKQLPPTRFFSSMLGEDDWAAQASDSAAALADMESILDRGLMVLPKSQHLRLRWHYRSRHESLVAFSNREFYDNDLVVFPSSHKNTDELGLTMCYEPADSYDRGSGGTNRRQAKRIAEWVFKHARDNPDKSLGVGAFSVRQQQAILDEIEKLRRQDDSVEEFFDHNKLEPFFVKNLETIQGDERDVILLSVGYGKGRPDERLSMNFGPLNQDGGWRRLNVLITRARQRCVVFSSIRGEDFDVTATQAKGVLALKGYLEYAHSGELPQIQVGGGEFGSDFEKAVYDALTEHGVKLDRQVGSAGFAIDLAVMDPDRPGRYILGIECDGATYHSSTTARDRDRLRQQVLEGLGWRIHRVWSTDWFRTPQRELERALDAIKRASSGQWRYAFVGSESPEEPVRGPEPAGEDTALLGGPAPVVPTERYKRFNSNRYQPSATFYTASLEDLAEVVTKVVQCEGPVHQDVLTRRTASTYGMLRVGPRIEDRIKRAIKLSLTQNHFARRDLFLWPNGMETPPVRTDREDELRDIDLICHEEIGRGAGMLLKAQFGMSREDLFVQTARLFGFGSTSQRVADRIGTAIDREIKATRILMGDRGQLRAAEQ